MKDDKSQRAPGIYVIRWKHDAQPILACWDDTENWSVFFEYRSVNLEDRGTDEQKDAIQILAGPFTVEQILGTGYAKDGRPSGRNHQGGSVIPHIEIPPDRVVHGLDVGPLEGLAGKRWMQVRDWAKVRRDIATLELFASGGLSISQAATDLETLVPGRLDYPILDGSAIPGFHDWLQSELEVCRRRLAEAEATLAASLQGPNKEL